MRIKFSLLATAMLVTATPAIAQDASRTETVSDDAIVVTAQKRDESIQDVAAAITAISGDDLTKQGIVDVTQLEKLVPSAKFTALRQSANIYIRGVGQTLNAANGDPAVAANLNGVYLPSEMVGGSIFDLERVEVLPGPQGTLYGRNAVGGVVNFITKRPGRDFGVDAFLEAGNYSRIHAFAGIDIPISDTLRARTAVNLITHDGYFKNGANDQDTKSARFTLEYTPTDMTTIRAVVGYNKEAGFGTANQNNPPLTADRWDLPFDPREQGLFVASEIWTGNLEISQDLSDALTLSYNGGYGELDGTNKIGVLLGPPLAFSLGDQSIENFTNELRLNGEWDHINGVVGLYHYYTNTDQFGALLRGTTLIATGPFSQKAEGYAAFGQLTYSLSDAVRLTAGGRISHDKKDFEGENSTTVNGTVTTRIPFEGKKSWNRFDWKLAAEADVAPDSMVYASVQSGYNQGGFSTAPATIIGNQASLFEPMTLIGYTLGSKNSFIDGKLTVNLEGFYYDYKNYQVSSRSPVTAQNEVFNADKATIYGVDIQARAKLSDADTFGIAASLLHAEFDRLRTPSGNFDGFEMPFSPDLTLSAQYSHIFTLASGATIEPWAQVAYTSKQWSKFDHPNGTQQKDFAIIDASLTYRAADERWSLSLWGRNLADTYSYILLLGPAVPGPGAGTLRPPRTYGVRLSTNF
jgi:iron complex outermembrane receptor protein